MGNSRLFFYDAALLVLIPIMYTEAVGICSLETDRRTVRCENLNVTSKALATNILDELSTRGDKQNYNTIIIDNAAACTKPNSACIRPSFALDNNSFSGYSVNRLVLNYVSITTPGDNDLVLGTIVNTLNSLTITNSRGVDDFLIRNAAVQLNSLTELYLDGNEIKDSLQLKQSQRYPNLRNLTLSRNCIEAITGDLTSFTGKLTKLSHLDLSFNPSRTCPGATEPWKALSGLNAAIFGYFPSLNRLSLASTGLKVMNFEDLANRLSGTLTHLDISSNDISNITGLEKMGQLRSLNMSGNSNALSNNKVLPTFPYLEILRVRNTGISVVPTNLLEKMPRLAVLDFRDNDLTTFPNSLTGELWKAWRNPPTRELLLHNNPNFQCNCDTSYLVHWAAASISHTPSGLGILCRSDGLQVCPSCRIGSTSVSLNDSSLTEQVLKNCSAIYPHNENGANQLKNSLHHKILHAHSQSYELTILEEIKDVEGAPQSHLSLNESSSQHVMSKDEFGRNAV